jgi:hypothetical protein
MSAPLAEGLPAPESRETPPGAMMHTRSGYPEHPESVQGGRAASFIHQTPGWSPGNVIGAMAVARISDSA